MFLQKYKFCAVQSTLLRNFAQISHMKTIFKQFITFVWATCWSIGVMAQVPTIAPTATFTVNETETVMQPGDNYPGQAPLKVSFNANPSDDEGWSASYEWRFYTESDMQNPYLIRYEQDTEYDFLTAGSHRIVCYVIFTKGDLIQEYTEEYWTQEIHPFKISISDSKLEMPNAFSPNVGVDDYNSTYRVKPGFQSIVEFRAIIFNRWGKKLYEWTDPAAEGWDGTYKGRPMPEGVYFVFVRAKGADGREFVIKRDVNLLRGYTQSTNVPSE